LAGAHNRHAFAFQAELAAGLCAVGDFHAGAAAVDGGDFELAAEGGRGKGDRDAAENVGAVALEEGVRLDAQEI
jgi:hypothetical protein